MNFYKFFAFALFITLSVQAQDTKTDNTQMGYVLTEADSIFGDNIVLHEFLMDSY